MGQAQTLAEYPEMQSGQEHEDWRVEIMTLLTSIDERVGRESKDGQGGTGMYGRLIRTETNVTSLLQDRNILRGAILVFTGLAATLAFILANIKSWLSGLPPHGGH